MRLIHILAVSEQKTWEGWGGGEGGAHRREECPGSESQGRAWGPLGAKPNPALSARVGLPPAWAAPSQRRVRGGREAGARPGCGRSASPRSTSLLPPGGQARDPPPRRPARGELRGALPAPPLLGAGLGGRAGHGSPGLEAPAPTPLPSPQRTAPPGTPGRAGPAPAEPPAPAEAVSAPRRPAAGAATHRPRPPRTRRPETGSSRSRRNHRRRRLPARQLPRGTARLARALSRSPQNDSDFLMNFIGSPGSEQAAQRRLRRGRRGAGDSTPLICGAAALRSMRRARSAPAPRRPARASPGLAGPGGRLLCVPRASWGTPGCSGDAGGGRSSCIVDSSKEELTKEDPCKFRLHGEHGAQTRERSKDLPRLAHAPYFLAWRTSKRRSEQKCRAKSQTHCVRTLWWTVRSPRWLIIQRTNPKTKSSPKSSPNFVSVVFMFQNRLE